MMERISQRRFSRRSARWLVAVALAGASVCMSASPASAAPIGGNPEGSGCPVTQTFGRSINLPSGTAYGEIRWSRPCGTGWFRINTRSFIADPSTWNPGGASYGQAGSNIDWRWTRMTAAGGGRQVCGGAQLYSLMGRYITWWYAGCVSTS